MTDSANLPTDTALQNLHERVNAMLDIPVPKEGDAFPLPVEAAVPAASLDDRSGETEVAR